MSVYLVVSHLSPVQTLLLTIARAAVLDPSFSVKARSTRSILPWFLYTLWDPVYNSYGWVSTVLGGDE